MVAIPHTGRPVTSATTSRYPTTSREPISFPANFQFFPYTHSIKTPRLVAPYFGIGFFLIFSSISFLCLIELPHWIEAARRSAVTCPHSITAYFAVIVITRTPDSALFMEMLLGSLTTLAVVD